ncbi:sensor histidine kinase [Bifidobacterium sp.]|jgi:signal transduction histidine kinase|uniref:sensor histidine kinase n=1 Tax=Bifidobacterium sp. TaxID=41200 RepID=UPI0025C1D718|nr:ATP-binding protein [Bifidobacterium sp.]MCH4209589.1 ATP-binding protein [Bifidobacterium sp.]MCI1225012.1 ATP-binding protein [Bifidobacterium sp.]
MPFSVSSVLIFAVFGLLAAAILAALLYTVADWLRPVITRLARPDSGLGDRIAAIRRRFGHRQDDDDEDDDLDDSTAALISMLDTVSIVVDGNDEVVRANPDAYALGVVSDDVIVDDHVLEHVRAVRSKGGRQQFELTTDTPERFIRVMAQAPGHSREQRLSASDGMQDTQGVSRPNWVKVTVGRINEHFVVVLLDDMSESIRFSQLRDSFIVNVSEQLLAPTQDLERLADTLEAGDLDIDQVRHEARQVKSSSRRLNHMVSDLLLLIKAQEPVTPTRANRLNVGEQVGQIVGQLAEESCRLRVPLVVDCDTTLNINGEGEQIRAAVRKLVENAMLYSPKGATVSVSARASRQGDQAVIRVIDRGQGIAKAEQSRVFERFYRGTNQNERTGEGIGLGLAIVKHVALTHHGSATVWSAPGQGSTFTLSLPLAR